jgi:hypothetical protein
MSDPAPVLSTKQIRELRTVLDLAAASPWLNYRAELGYYEERELSRRIVDGCRALLDTLAVFAAHIEGEGHAMNCDRDRIRARRRDPQAAGDCQCAYPLAAELLPTLERK